MLEHTVGHGSLQGWRPLHEEQGRAWGVASTRPGNSRGSHCTDTALLGNVEQPLGWTAAKEKRWRNERNQAKAVPMPRWGAKNPNKEPFLCQGDIRQPEHEHPQCQDSTSYFRAREHSLIQLAMKLWDLSRSLLCLLILLKICHSSALKIIPLTKLSIMKNVWREHLSYFLI